MLTHSEVAAHTDHYMPIAFGDWYPEIDESLFEHTPYDHRSNCLVSSDILCYTEDEDGERQVCAISTARKLREYMRSHYGVRQDTECPEKLRWKASPHLTDIVGPDGARQLLTYLNIHVMDKQSSQAA